MIARFVLAAALVALVIPAAAAAAVAIRFTGTAANGTFQVTGLRAAQKVTVEATSSAAGCKLAYSKVKTASAAGAVTIVFPRDEVAHRRLCSGRTYTVKVRDYYGAYLKTKTITVP